MRPRKHVTNSKMRVILCIVHAVSIHFYKKCSSYSAISSTSALLKRAQENYVFIGPRLFVNAHLDVILVKIEDI